MEADQIEPVTRDEDHWNCGVALPGATPLFISTPARTSCPVVCQAAIVHWTNSHSSPKSFSWARSAQQRAEIQQNLRRGYALDNEKAELGIGCIVVIVRDADGGRPVAGFSVSARLGYAAQPASSARFEARLRQP